jgi:hypothetical protein
MQKKVIKDAQETGPKFLENTTKVHFIQNIL